MWREPLYRERESRLEVRQPQPSASKVWPKPQPDSNAVLLVREGEPTDQLFVGTNGRVVLLVACLLPQEFREVVGIGSPVIKGVRRLVLPGGDTERFTLAHWPDVELHESKLELCPRPHQLASAPEVALCRHVDHGPVRASLTSVRDRVPGELLSCIGRTS